MSYREIIAVALAFVGGIVTQVIGIKVAFRMGLLDRPHSLLKVHSRETPHTGGIAVALAVLGGMAIIAPQLPTLSTRQVIELVAILIIMVVGLIDDRWHMAVWLRLLFQIACALLLVFTGGIVELTPWRVLNIFITVLGIVALINAINLIDIMDGLAGGITLMMIAALTYALFHYQGAFYYRIAGLTFCAALLAFLIFNFNPARVFLGDNGSTMLGLVTSLLVIRTAQASHNDSGTIAAAIIVSLPLFELVFVSVIRIWRRRNPLRGSPDHFPLRLKTLGHTVRQTVSIIYFFMLLTLTSAFVVIYANRMGRIITCFVMVLFYSIIWWRLSKIEVD